MITPEIGFSIRTLEFKPAFSNIASRSDTVEGVSLPGPYPIYSSCKISFYINRKTAKFSKIKYTVSVKPQNELTM
jgi:hypothetical protein